MAEVLIHSPPNTLPRCDTLWAYLSRDPNGNEGLCGAPIGPMGLIVPLFTADREQLKHLTPIAEQLAAASGMTIVLVEYSSRTDLRQITGKTDG